jgi:7-cyano-7-deazaguanine reductase
MAKAEGQTLEFDGPERINPTGLETFPYEGPKQWVEYKTQEFSAVCPFSGLPDFGELVIEYIPRAKCVELKSLKYYLLSYRNVGIYQEHAAARLFQDIEKLLEPQFLKITLTYQTRGGIDTTCKVSTEDSKN